QHAGRDDRDAVAAIRQPSDRNAEQGVESRERDAAQQADLGVSDAEVVLDGSEQQRQNLAVDERERIQQCEDTDGVPHVGQRGTATVLPFESRPSGFGSCVHGRGSASGVNGLPRPGTDIALTRRSSGRDSMAALAVVAYAGGTFSYE